MTTNGLRRLLLMIALIGAPIGLAGCAGDSLGDSLSIGPGTVVAGDGMY